MPRSLRWRLAVWLVLGVVLMWTSAAFVTVSNLRREMDEAFDSALAETAQRLLPLAVLDITDREEDGVARSVDALHMKKEYFTYIVRNRDGRILLRSRTADDTIFPPFTQTGFVNSPTHRIYFDSVEDGAYTIAVAEPLSRRTEVLNEAFTGLATPLGVMIPFSILAVWVLVHISLRPLQAFRAEIEKRGSGDMAPVSLRKLPTEVKPVAEAINNLLDRLQRTLAAERSFTSNSAHELRTPVAAALAQTQRLMAEISDPAALERARNIESSLHRLARLSEKLMQLAKAEGGGLVAEKSHDLGPIVAMILDELSTQKADRARIHLNKPDAPVLSRIDLDAFAILVRNLIENALKHGDPEQPIDVTLGADGSFRVANGGTVLSPRDLTRLTRSFERGPTEADGTGLGLSIARTIATGAGGQLQLRSPASGKTDGFEARFIPNATAER